MAELPAIANDEYITATDIAKRLHMDPKTVREMFIVGRQVRYLKIGRKYLIVKKSFLEWEEQHQTRVLSRR